MKVLVALAVVALAAADSDSFYPGYPYHQGFQQGLPFNGHLGYRMPYHFQQPQVNPFLMQQPAFQHQQHQRLFRRDAESDSDSFYPGFPFVPPQPYHHQQPYFGHHQPSPYMQSPYTPYMARPYGMHPVQQQFTTYSHPMMMNPLLKLAEKTAEKKHSVEKRDSESESFYPGYPYMPPQPYYQPQQFMHQQYAQPAYHQQTYGLPNVVPRVLPYNFPGMFNGYQNPYTVKSFKPAMEKVEKKLE